MRHFALIFVLLFLLSPAALAEGDMDREIDHLIDTVASSGCVFIRNGKEYDSAAAKDHLDLKRRKGKKYFSSADEFIENLASSSSWSGKPYHIRCGDGDPVPSGDWFRKVLEDYRGN